MYQSFLPKISDVLPISAFLLFLAFMSAWLVYTSISHIVLLIYSVPCVVRLRNYNSVLPLFFLIYSCYMMMKAAVLAIAAAMAVGVNAGAHAHARQAHHEAAQRNVFEAASPANETCVPQCTTVYYTMHGSTKCELR